MKKFVLLLVSFVVAVPMFAADVSGLHYAQPTPLPDLQVSFAEMMRSIAAQSAASPRIRPNVVLEGSEAGFVFPIVGSTPASGGLFFRSETVIINRRTVPQNIAVYYFPFGGGAANCNKLPKVVRMDAQSLGFWTDFVSEFLGTSGLGAVIVLGITSNGSVDNSAALDGNSRIWTPQPGTNGTASQNFPSVSLQMPPGTQSSFGLRSDEFYRANYGIFNYDTVARTFDITVSGLRGRTSFSTNVDACSAVLSPISGGPYGSFELAIGARDGRAAYFTYGSSVDNATGDSWSVIGRSF